MRLGRARWVLVVSVLVSLAAGAAGGYAVAAQPFMLAARGHLGQALGDLQAAAPNKAGHRERAMELVRAAIEQVNLGISAGM
jgi:hypothetical protein